jgi:hypothetical protein
MASFPFDLKSLPRCCAKSRSNEDRPCKQAAMKNGRCYWHGGATKIKHGKETRQAHTERTRQRQVINELRATIKSLEPVVYKRTQGSLR